MKDLIDKYVRILTIELEDLEEDIESLISFTTERASRREITEYVCRENVTLLRSEFSGIRTILNAIGKLEHAEYQDLESFVKDLRLRLMEQVKSSYYPDAVFVLVERKLKKVLHYVRSDL